MINAKQLPITITVFATLLSTAGFCAADGLTVKAVNQLSFARADQTIELSADQLAPLGVNDLETIHVTDSASKELLSQAGRITTPAAWEKYVSEFAQGVQTPIEVSVSNN